jgi:hypothetical protein
MKPLVAALLLCVLLTLFARVAHAQAISQPSIIGDLSGSMRGFAEASGTSLGNLYQILVINIPTAQLKGLKTRVDQVPQNQARFFAMTKNYGGDTDLADAIKVVRENNQQAVLVTDGMQSRDMYLGVKEQLGKMAEDGWGIWLLELDLPFHGVYDTEMPVDLNTLQASIEECARKRDPQAQVTVQKNSERLYDYKGTRPLLIFVFSRDAAQGRPMAQKILSNVKADPRFSPRVVELAPLTYRGIEFAEPQPGDAADYLRVDDFATGNPIIHSDPADEKRVKDLILPIVWSAEPPPLPQVFDETSNYDVNVNQCSWLYDEPADEPLSADQDPRRVTGIVRIRLISEVSWLRSHLCWIPGISCSEEKSDLLKFSAASEFTPVENGWWDELSTDTSWECPNKVFKLSELVKDVAANAVKRHQEDRRDRKLSFKLIVGPL